MKASVNDYFRQNKVRILLFGLFTAFVSFLAPLKSFQLKWLIDSSSKNEACRSDPREKERIHDLAAKCTACAVRHRFKITEMFLSAGQRSTSRLSRFDSEQHPLSRFPSRSIKKGL